ncbi:hypothetical protein F4604DRAFT_1584478, partial [Suillus subluteus]
VYVFTTPDQCRKWNGERADGKRYKHETLHALIQRFEELSSTVRWDAPLFTIPLGRPNTTTRTHIRHTTNALVLAAGPLGEPIVLTLNALKSSSNTSANESSVLHVHLTLPHRALTLSELQRLKRQFVAAHRKAVNLGEEGRGGRAFAEFLEEGLGVGR